MTRITKVTQCNKRHNIYPSGYKAIYCDIHVGYQWGVVTTPFRFSVRFRIVYRVIQRLIQHCLLRTILHLNSEYSPRNSISNLKQHYSAALGLGALLSSPT